MSRTRVTLITLMCVLRVWFSRISGAEEVSIRVRPGDDVTLYCDCVLKTGFYAVWFRNCSHEHQPPLLISSMDLISFSEVNKDLVQDAFLGYTLVWNPSNNTYDLLVKNISESDLGLYYCALLEKKVIEDTAGKVCVRKAVYRYGNRTTQLSLLETTSTSTPPVSDCSVCWKLLVSVCPVCVLLSSLLSSTCVYFICRTRIKGSKKQTKTNRHRKQNRKSAKIDKFGEEEDGVCYASLDLPNRGQKRRKKKKRVESSDFSTYSEVKTDRTGALNGPAD